MSERNEGFHQYPVHRSPATRRHPSVARGCAARRGTDPPACRTRRTAGATVRRNRCGGAAEPVPSRTVSSVPGRDRHRWVHRRGRGIAGRRSTRVRPPAPAGSAPPVRGGRRRPLPAPAHGLLPVRDHPRQGHHRIPALRGGAAFGATVAAFPWGWPAGLPGVLSEGPVAGFVPVIVTLTVVSGPARTSSRGVSGRSCPQPPRRPGRRPAPDVRRPPQGGRPLPAAAGFTPPRRTTAAGRRAVPAGPRRSASGCS